MSKMSELSAAVVELRNCAVALTGVADTLQDLFSNDETQDSPVSQANPEVKQPTLEDVRAVLARKSVEGHTAEIQTLIRKYGADKLSKVELVHYSALLTDAEGL